MWKTLRYQQVFPSFTQDAAAAESVHIRLYTSENSITRAMLRHRCPGRNPQKNTAKKLERHKINASKIRGFSFRSKIFCEKPPKYFPVSSCARWGYFL